MDILVAVVSKKPSAKEMALSRGMGGRRTQLVRTLQTDGKLTRPPFYTGIENSPKTLEVEGSNRSMWRWYGNGSG